METDYTPSNERIKELFSGMSIPTTEDWSKLAKAVQQNGMFHAYRLAIAPTQSIGYVQNATASIIYLLLI